MIGGRPVVALPVLVSGLEAEMIRLGYKDSTMVWYHGAWRRLQRYFAARGVPPWPVTVIVTSSVPASTLSWKPLLFAITWPGGAVTAAPP